LIKINKASELRPTLEMEQHGKQCPQRERALSRLLRRKQWWDSRNNLTQGLRIPLKKADPETYIHWPRESYVRKQQQFSMLSANK